VIESLKSEADDLEASAGLLRGLALDELEELREQNEKLREWGQYWKEQAEKFEAEANTAEERVAELEREVA
jgi:hypothetical protein